MGVFTIGCDDCSTPALRRSGAPAQPMVGALQYPQSVFQALILSKTLCPDGHTGWPRLTLRGEVAFKARGAGRLHLKISGQKKAYR